MSDYSMCDGCGKKMCPTKKAFCIECVDKPMTSIIGTEAVSDQYNRQAPTQSTQYIDNCIPPAICTDSYQNSNQRDEKGAEFDEKAAEYEYSKFTPNHPAWSEKNGFIEGARWQHRQLKAQLEEMNKNCISLSLHDSRIWALEEQLAKLQQQNDVMREALKRIADRNAHGVMVTIAREALEAAE